MPAQLSNARTVNDWIGEAFDAASAELITRRSLLRRIDSKFLLPREQLEGLLADIRSDYGALSTAAGPLARYQTLYFDTPALRCFHDHRRGRRPRYKVRVRHYLDRELSFLEVKKKRSEYLTIKRRRPIRFGEIDLGAADFAFVAEHSDLDPDELVPEAWTNFRRLSLVGFDFAERVTIDVNLELVASDGARRSTLDHLVIVEVKQSPFCTHTPIMRALRARRLRPVSASKYCTAAIEIHEELRANRLLPAYRAIRRCNDVR